jgi:hypothetical protein
LPRQSLALQVIQHGEGQFGVAARALANGVDRADRRFAGADQVNGAPGNVFRAIGVAKLLGDVLWHRLAAVEEAQIARMV